MKTSHHHLKVVGRWSEKRKLERRRDETEAEDNVKDVIQRITLSGGERGSVVSLVPRKTNGFSFSYQRFLGNSVRCFVI